MKTLKTHPQKRWQRMLVFFSFFFYQGIINWHKWLKHWEIMKLIWKETSQEKLCLFWADFNELFIIGQVKLLLEFFFWSFSFLCKIIMATWSEEEEGSRHCNGVSWWWCGPKLIKSFLWGDHSVEVSKQLHYEADQIIKGATQQFVSTLFQCLNSNKSVK